METSSQSIAPYESGPYSPASSHGDVDWLDEKNDVFLDYLDESIKPSIALQEIQADPKPIPRAVSLPILTDALSDQNPSPLRHGLRHEKSTQEAMHLQANLDTAIATIAQLQTQLAQANGTCERLREEVNRMQSNEASAVKTADSAIRTVDVLREKLRATTDEKLSKATLTDTPQRDDSQTIRLECELELARSAISKLEAKVEALESTKLSTLMELDTTANQLKHCQQAHFDCQQLLQETRDECTKWKQQAQAVDAAAQQTTEAVETLMEEKRQLERQFQDFRSQRQVQSTFAMEKAAATLREKHRRLADAWLAVKRAIKAESRKTAASFTEWANDCTEVCLRHNEREVALSLKLAKMHSWQNQLRAERAKTMTLQQQLWKAESSRDKIKSQLQEELDGVKDHLNVLMAVKVGLVADVQASRDRHIEEESTVAELRREIEQLQKKNIALQQHLQVEVGSI
ncbi:unnamed protein product [Aphanomyces euteiches]